MTNEIKEILDNIKTVIDEGHYRATCDIDYEDCKILLDYINNLPQEDIQLKEKIEYLKEQKENKNKWCQLIADIGFDYDGFNKVESLKELIDELVQYALYARDDYNYEEYILKGDSNE